MSPSEIPTPSTEQILALTKKAQQYLSSEQTITEHRSLTPEEAAAFIQENGALTATDYMERGFPNTAEILSLYATTTSKLYILPISPKAHVFYTSIPEVYAFVQSHPNYYGHTALIIRVDNGKVSEMKMKVTQPIESIPSTTPELGGTQTEHEGQTPALR